MPGPPRANLARRRFGLLKVIEFDAISSGSPYWWCECQCGHSACEGRISVKATRLTTRKTEHCAALGYRRDPERHKTARAKVPAKKRQQIAAMGAKVTNSTRRSKSRNRLKITSQS